jgi:hypothetical protein
MFSTKNILEIPMLEVELSWCFKFFEVIGLQYFHLKDLNARTLHNRPSFFRLIYMLTFSSALILMWFASMTKTFNTVEKLTAKNILMFAAEKILMTGITFMLLTGVVQSYCMIKTNKKMIMKFQESFDVVEQDLGEKLNLKKLKRDLNFKFLLMCFVYFSLHGIAAFNGRNKEGLLLGKVFGILPLTVTMSSFYKNIFYMELVKFNLNYLKKSLGKIFQNYPMTIIENINFHSTADDEINDLKKLKSLRKFYNLTKELADLQNVFFGLTNLLYLCTSVIYITIGGFNFYVAIIGKNDDKFEGNLN